MTCNHHRSIDYTIQNNNKSLCLQFPAEEATVLVLQERVNEAQRLAARELREMQNTEGSNGRNKKRKSSDGNGYDGGDGEDGDSKVKDVMSAGRHKKKGH